MEIAIVDNSRTRGAALGEVIKKTVSEVAGKPLNINIKIFTSGIDFVSDYNPVYEIIFIETDLPMISGLSVARRIRRIDDCVSIILVSNTDKYAINGYDVSATGYILRPVDPLTVNNILVSFFAKRNTGKDIVYIHIKNGIRKVFADDLCYVEARGHSLIFKLSGEEITGIGTLVELESTLETMGFLRCSKSYIVNPNHIYKFEGNSVLCGGEKITVSRSRLRSFKTYFNTLCRCKMSE